MQARRPRMRAQRSPRLNRRVIEEEKNFWLHPAPNPTVYPWYGHQNIVPKPRVSYRRLSPMPRPVRRYPIQFKTAVPDNDYFMYIYLRHRMGLRPRPPVSFPRPKYGIREPPHVLPVRRDIRRL